MRFSQVGKYTSCFVFILYKYVTCVYIYTYNQCGSNHEWTQRTLDASSTQPAIYVNSRPSTLQTSFPYQVECFIPSEGIEDLLTAATPRQDQYIPEPPTSLLQAGRHSMTMAGLVRLQPSNQSDIKNEPLNQGFCCRCGKKEEHGRYKYIDILHDLQPKDLSRQVLKCNVSGTLYL